MSLRMVLTGCCVAGVGGTTYLWNMKKNLTVVWDLDSCVMQNLKDDENEEWGVAPVTTLRFGETNYHIHARNFAVPTIKFLSWLGVEQHVYTSATRGYMNGVIDGMGIRPYLQQTLSREDTVVDEAFLGNFVCPQKLLKSSEDRKYRYMLAYWGKDVDLLNLKTDRYLLVDDQARYHAPQSRNGIWLRRTHIGEKDAPLDYEMLVVLWTILKCMFVEVDEFHDVIQADGASPVEKLEERWHRIMDQPLVI